MCIFLKLNRSYTLILCFVCSNIIKLVMVKRGPLDFYCIFLCMVFVLTYFRMV